MGFRDGHIIKFRKQIKNNHHLLTFQKMQSEFNEEQKTEQKEQITSEQSMGIMQHQMSDICMQSPIPKPKTDATTITHEQFWYKLEQFSPNERYYLEIKSGNNAWKQNEEIIISHKKSNKNTMI